MALTSSSLFHLRRSPRTLWPGDVLIRRLLITVVIAAFGAVTAVIGHLDGLAYSTAFFTVASALLAIGLFSSTSSIPLAELTAHWRVVVTAVTVGVVAKAALISVVMYAIFREPAYIVLGAAMAQIDPLSVAALRQGSRLSARGRAILAAWSAFDDPVTTILVILLAGLAIQASQPGLSVAAVDLMAMPVATVAGNALLLAGAGVVWLALRWVPGRPDGDSGPSLRWQVLSVIALIGLATVAVIKFLMLALAATGLFFRPRIDRLLDRATGLAFVAATFLLGIVVAGGVNVVQGMALGLTAYLAQVTVGLVISRRLPGDRLRLAVSQQSGITAILLALLLEPALPGTVGVVAPAILVVNILHWAANAFLDHRDGRSGPVAEPAATQSP